MNSGAVHLQQIEVQMPTGQTAGAAAQGAIVSGHGNVKARKAATIAHNNAAANSAHEYGGYSTGNTAAGPGSASQHKMSASSKQRKNGGGMYSTHQQKQ